MLIIAGVVSMFGLLVTVPPMVNEALAPHWVWATPHVFLIILLTLSMLALIGLWHQQRYLSIIQERLEQSREDVEATAKKNSIRLCALLDVTQVMEDEAGVETVVDRITETCADVFNCDQVSLMFYDEASESLIVRAVGGPLANRNAVGAQQRIGEGISGWAAERREGLLLGQGFDAARYPGLEFSSATIFAAMVVPIVLSDVLVGVVNVSTQSSGVDYDADDFHALVVFAENVGACIRNAQSRDHMKHKIRELETALRTNRSDIGSLAVTDAADPKP